MVTSNNVAQRRVKSAAAKRAPARRVSARRPARRYRQANAGDNALPYPFDPESVPSRTPARQKTVEDYARMVLPQGTYNYMKQQGVKWLPSDADAIRTHTNAAGRNMVARFIASMFVLDLAHATIDKMKKEAKYLSGVKGSATSDNVKRIGAIISNTTGMIVTGADVASAAALESKIKAGGALNTKVQDGSVMYPITYTAKKSLAHDTFLYYILSDLHNGEFSTDNYSLMTRVKVFSPLGLDSEDVNSGRRTTLLMEAEDAAAIGKDDSAIFTVKLVAFATAIGGGLPTSSATVSMDSLSDSILSGGDSIQTREIRILEAGIDDLTRTCERALRNYTGFKSDAPRMPGSKSASGYFYPTCGNGEIPIFLDPAGAPVKALKTSNPGEYFAPEATSVVCVPASGKSKMRQAPASISLRQVEALPKKELAKFVQVILKTHSRQHSST